MTRLTSTPTLSARVDGEPALLSTRPRQLGDLPFPFWMHLLIGGINFVMAAGVLAYRPADPAARHYALFGAGVLLTPYTATIYLTRELLIDGALLHALSTLNHLFLCLTVAALVALMSTYPGRLGARLPALAYTAGMLAWLGQFTRAFAAPNAVYLITLSFFALGLGLAYPQWQRTRGHPVERAALRWFLLSLLLGTGLFAALVALPLAFDQPPPVDQTWLTPLFLLVPAGIALGIVRYRLFELDRWWRSVWTWFFGGVAVMALDLTLLTLFDLTRLGAITLSLALLGWLYFPARQWLWARWLGGPPAAERHTWLRELSAAANPAELRARWLAALHARYAPLESRHDPGTEALIETPSPGARIEDDGLTLRVPDPLSTHDVLLRHADGGARLFGTADAADADTLAGLARLLREAMHERDQAVADERQRIRRDLHDDLGAKLLALLYRVDAGDQPLVRSAIRDSHEILAALDAEPLPLADAVAQWRAEAQERAITHGFQLDWRAHRIDEPTDDGNAVLDARQHTNLARIVREAISNAVRHAGARHVAIDITRDGYRLGLNVTDQGQANAAPADWRNGGGTRQIAQRAEELGGEAAWEPADGGTRLRVSVPLQRSTARGRDALP